MQKNPSSYVMGDKRYSMSTPLNLFISMKRLVGFENDFNGIYFHHHFYIKNGVKSL